MSDFSKLNHPRRRNNIQQLNINVNSNTKSTTSLVNFSKHTSNFQSNTAIKSEEKKNNLKKSLDSFVVNFSTSSASFSDISNLITSPAAQFWNTAQTSIQQLTQQYSQNLETNINIKKEPIDCGNLDCNSVSIEMPFRDRTFELRCVIKSNQLKYQQIDTSKNDKRELMLRSSIQFNQLARRIGRDLSITCAKLEKLTQLAKKKSLFQDQTREMDELSQVLKQDITGLNKQISNLQIIAVQRPIIATHRDHQGHSKLVVVGLQSKLADVSKKFQDIIEICTENIKFKKNRREKFSQPSCVPSSLPPNSNLKNKGSLLLYDDAVASGSSSFALNMDSLEQQRMQDQLLLIDNSQLYNKDRLSTMENIESSISELGTIFRQLASLVSEQGEIITRIDSNVEQTSLNVEAAHYELLQYFNNISKNRWLIIKVFGVLMMFFIFFVIFMT